MDLHFSNDKSTGATVPALPPIADCGAASESEYIPAVGDTFTIRWKHHFDRSYIDTIWRATNVDGDCVQAVREAGGHTFFDKVIFRTFDVAFAKISPQLPSDWRQSVDLLYVLRNGSNFYEVSVTMANGSRAVGPRADFAAKLLLVMEAQP